MVDWSPGFFDVDDRLAELPAKGDDLERVKALQTAERLHQLHLLALSFC